MFAYYVYQYSTGISAAVAIADRIRNEGEEAAGDYRQALRLGGKEYPVDVLKRAGVDVTTSEYIKTAIDVYGDLLDDAAEIVYN
jgi:oligoendopeptidase F